MDQELKQWKDLIPSSIRLQVCLFVFRVQQSQLLVPEMRKFFDFQAIWDNKPAQWQIHGQRTHLLLYEKITEKKKVPQQKTFKSQGIKSKYHITNKKFRTKMPWLLS